MSADGRVTNTALQSQIASIVARLDRMGDDITAIKAMLERLDERIRVLENSDASAHPLLQSRLDAAWRTIDVHEGRIKRLEEVVSELRQANKLLAWVGALLGSTVVVWLITQLLQVIR